MKRFEWLLILGISFLGPAFAVAAVATSPSYVLERDSINFGGDLSNSANYSLEDTAGEVATGFGSSGSFNLRAGYQQMDDSATISVSASGTISMSPALTTNLVGTSFGQGGVLVSTNNPTGYNLYIQTATSHALTSGSDSFTDYVPVGADPDFDFNNQAGAKQFAYSPEGQDVVARFQDDGVFCNIAGGETANKCWDGLTTSPVNIATANSLNTPTGTYTNIKLGAAIGSGVTLAAGTYSASLIFSAVMQ